MISALGVLSQDLAVEVAPVAGVASSRVSHIVETADGRLWFGGPGGLQCHDGQTVYDVALPEVVGERQRIRCLAAAANGDLLVSAIGGLYRVAARRRVPQRVAGTRDLKVYQIAAGDGGGVWIRSPSRLLHIDADGRRTQQVLPGGSNVAGFVAGDGRRWVWATDRLWVARSGGRDLLDVADVRIHAAATDGDALVFTGPEGVGRVTEDGAVTWLDRDVDGGELLLRDDGAWVRTTRKLFWVPRSGDGAQRVHMFENEQPCADTELGAIAVDAQGLLWLGWELGARRVCLCDGVENLRIPILAVDERVNVLAGAPDGGLWLGSSQGRLLRCGARCSWREVAAPWSDGEAVSAIEFDARGRVLAATWSGGVFRRDDVGWQQVLPEQLPGARAFLRRGDDVLVCGNKEVSRLAADGTLSVLPIRGLAADGRAPLPRSFAWNDEHVYLCTYRGGVYRLNEAEGCFEHWALDATVLGAALGADGELFANCIHETFRVGPDGDVAKLDLEGASSFRAIETAASGAAWIACAGHLFSVEDGVVRALPADLGAHPLGHSFLARARLADGSVLFGSYGGYTRLSPGATLRSAERARVAGAWIRDSANPGVRIPVADDPVAVRGDSFRIELAVHDRSRDLPTNAAVVVWKDVGGAALLSRGGEFVLRHGGDYVVDARFEEATGVVARVRLGRLRVVRPLPPWLFAVGAGLALVPLLVFSWRRHRRRAERRSIGAREDIAASLGDEGDEVLDLAFLVVAAAEACAVEADASEHTVWLSIRGRPRLLLSRVGEGPGVAEQRVAAFADDDSCSCRTGLRDRSVDGRHDLLAVLDGGEDLRFKVLLSSGTPWNDDRRDRVARGLEPARAALTRNVWLARLQQYCVRSGMSLEADLHDLRAPLSALRIGIHDLLAEHGRPDPTIQGLSDATECLIQAVDRLQAPDTVDREVRELVPLVDDAVRAMTSRAEERDITVRLSTPPGARPFVSVDDVWFGRAMRNLIGNALKYSDVGATVDVRVTVEGDEVLVVVEDEGPGIRPEEWEYVFLPGATGKNQPRDGEPQTGIGLWVSRQAIRAMGGRIWLAAAPGGGTAVWIALPRVAREADPV